MDKICLVSFQYGKEVNGGGEIHCKMLAERLSKYYDVDVITTTVVDLRGIKKIYEEGVDEVDGIRVLRFDLQDCNEPEFWKIRKSYRWGRKVRRNLFRLGLLGAISQVHPKWDFMVEGERKTLLHHPLLSTKMMDYFKEHGHQYKAIIPMCYPYPHTYFLSELFPEKVIMIPTAHNEGDLYRSIYTHLFSKVYHIAFNTEEEKKLCKTAFGSAMAPSSVIGVGIELEEPLADNYIAEKWNIKDDYVLYFGRITAVKIGQIIPWFLEFKQKYNHPSLKLVLTGRSYIDKVDHPDIIYTDFVSEAEKSTLIKHSSVVVNPSSLESLSLLLIEAMSFGKEALVNGQCRVMRGHSIKSKGACTYYTGKNDFHKKLDQLLKRKTSQERKQKIQQYVSDNYDWNKIINSFVTLIDDIPQQAQ